MPDQTVDQFPRALEQGGFRDHLIESGGMRAPQTGCVGVIRVPEDRDVRVRLRDVRRVDARDVGDHEIGRLDSLMRLERVLGQQRLELAADEEVDAAEENRRHVG